MVNSSNEDQDPSKGSIDTSTAMTIEFLRARLLAERSVSRTSRRRANELVKRVIEQEEQLNIVASQRRQAEKATRVVLAILENHSINDAYEATDSGSDPESTLNESKLVNNARRGKEVSAGLKFRRNVMEEFCGNEVESSASTSKGLSSKGGKSSLRSVEKRKSMDSARRWRGFTSTGSSSTEHVDKSHPHTQLIETRTLKGHPKDSQETSLDGDPASGILENEREDEIHFFRKHGEDKDMEKALEHQAQLIQQYEAEENAQREWEERFRECRSCTPDSCDMGNHSDVTEERDEIKTATPPCSTETTALQTHGVKLDVGEIFINKESKTPSDPQLNPMPQTVTKRSSHEENFNGMVSPESHASEFEFSVPRKVHDLQYSENHQYSHLNNSHNHIHSRISLENHLAEISSSYMGSGSSNVKASASRNELALVPHQAPNKIGSVLEALQHAKLSLKHEVGKLPLVEAKSIGDAIATSIPAVRNYDKQKIPVDCPGLFRLPTDPQFRTSNQASVLSSDSQFNWYKYSGSNIGDKVFPSPYMESLRSRSMNTMFSTTPAAAYMQTREGLPPATPSFGAALPSTSRQSDASSMSNLLVRHGEITYPTYPLLLDPVTQITSSEALPRAFPIGDVGLPPATPFSSYGYENNPNMYR